MGFLEKIAGKFLAEYGNNIHKIAFVFPTRRACLYFTRHLQKQKETNVTIWAPPVFSINDFLANLAQVTAADQLDLIFDLYRIYKKHIRAYRKKFEDFYGWGKMILSDFDEIDKYLIDTEELFRTLKEFKAVEDITKEEKADIYNRYTGFWQDLGVLHREFKQGLKEKNRAYEGMVYREVAENIETIAANRLPWQKVVFCGLNALTKAEEIIISHLLQEEKAEIFWDMDRYFVEDKNQEAGYFFRKNRKTLKLEDPAWVEEQLAEPKKINLIGVQSKVSQAKVLGIKLEELLDAAHDPESIAVVLPDETLLFPVLNSLPKSVDRINITIGFPLQQTPVFSLFNSILEMYLRIYGGGAPPSKKSEEGFYHKDIQKVLNHPYIKPVAPGEITEFIKKNREQNNVYVPANEIIFSEEALNDLFRFREESREVIDFFLELLDFIRTFYTENKPDIFSIDYEYIYHFYTLMSRLKGSLKSSREKIDIRIFRQLFTDIIRNSRIPFTGEPLEGLQVMGMLETQTLDFTNLFVLSVNEGHLPPGKSQQSFIPFDVRAIMGLPIYKDRDAIAAYHFYRLLKSSRNTTLIYTTEARGIEKSEKSRFIDQVLIEYAERNKNAVINHQVIDFQFDAQQPKEISIQKSEKIIELLSQKSYSASSLLNYLTCPLKYYFNHVLRLREEEEVYESPEYYQIGYIIHHALHQLYQPYCGKGKPVGIMEIEAIKEKIDQTLTTAYLKELEGANLRTGRNKIAFEVMKRFLENFFEKEKQDAGFKIVMLEEHVKDVWFPFSINGTGYRVQLTGTVDRLDFKDDVYRVIDYKTGKINSLNLKSLEELSGAEAVNRKEVFQLFFYRYLLMQKEKYGGEYRLGIYPFKKMYDELKFVKIDKSDIIDEGLVEEFEGLLKDIFRELLDITVPFVQTADEKNCQHCPYQNICSKEAGESYFG
ncbi:MAG: hypothetical protein GY950_02180 [bacterium]|nr:hypothetical protein [bacterium]